MHDELNRLDLNLLVALHMLLEERSVTRAADRLCITQPAMSKTLQRLRAAVADPLFVRAGRNLVLTPRAKLFAEKLGPILAEISEMVFTDPFRPESASGEISIMASDTLAISMIPELFASVRVMAPGVKLISDSFSELHLDMLAEGKRDFSIYIDHQYSQEFVTFPLLHLPHVCWMRKGHPLAGNRFVSAIDVRRYGALSLTLPDRGHLPRDNAALRIVDSIKRYGLGEAVQMHVVSLMTALRIIANSDVLMLGVPLFNGPGPYDANLTHRPFKEARAMTAELVLIQHKRTLDSPLHSWIRERILEIGRRTDEAVAARTA